MLDNGVVNSNGNGSANGAVSLVPPVIVYPAPQASPLATAAPAQEATPETLIFRAGLLTPDQLGELVQERVSSGRAVEQIVVERGWASADAVARALGLEPPVVEAPTPPVELAPPVELIAAPLEIPAAVAEPTPLHLAAVPVEAVPVEDVQVAQAQAEPVLVEPTLSVPIASEHIQVRPEVTTDVERGVEVEFCVVLRFAGQETVEVARFAEVGEAKAAAESTARELATAQAEWPFLGGLFVRPEAVLFVDVDASVG